MSHAPTVHFSCMRIGVNDDEWWWWRGRFLNENFHISTLRRNTSAYRICRTKIRTLSLYKLNPSYRLSLVKTQSVQRLLRSDNIKYSQLTGSRIDTRCVFRCFAVLGTRHYRVSWFKLINLGFLRFYMIKYTHSVLLLQFVDKKCFQFCC